MTRVHVLLLAALVASPLSCRHPGNPHPDGSIGIDAYPGVRDLHRFAEEQRAKHGWPALGLGIIHKGTIVGLGMAGERKLGSGQWATLTDRFDAGSVAKSMTATVAAMLVEAGQLRWDSRIADVVPDWQRTMLPAYAGVTLEQLLGHRSGLDQWMNTNARFSAWNREHHGRNATEQRLLFGAAALQRPPRHPPGTAHYYCNDGYFIAGSLIERATGQPFEEFVRRRLFEPLALTSARFGPDPSREAVVWGHEPGSFGWTKAIAPDPAEYGHPPFGSPGGFLYATVPDLLRYVNFHIEGATGHGRLLSPDSFDRLFTPLQGQTYALGWNVEITRDSSGRMAERSVFHGGYSGRFRANVWFSPESRWGTVIVGNYGGGDGADMSAVFYALLREYGLLTGRAGP